MNVAAGHGGLDTELSDDATTGGNLDLQKADVALENFLVALLDAQLADVRDPCIHGCLLFPLQSFLVKARDSADVAQQMRRRLPIRVAANGASLDAHAGQLLDAHGHPGHLLIGELGLKGDGVELAGVGQVALEATNVGWREVEQGGELFNERVDIALDAGLQLHREARIISRQHFAVAVEDEPPGRLHGQQGNSIVLGLDGVVLVLPDLQGCESYAQQANADGHHNGRNGHPFSKVRGGPRFSDHVRARSLAPSQADGPACV